MYTVWGTGLAFALKAGIIFRYAGIIMWVCSAVVGLIIRKSQVQTPAGAAGKFSSPELIFCADSCIDIRSTPVLPQQH